MLLVILHSVYVYTVHNIHLSLEAGVISSVLECWLGMTMPWVQKNPFVDGYLDI